MFVVFLDQLSKYIVVENIQVNSSITLNSLIKLHHLHNYGAAFGSFKFLGDNLIFLVLGAATIVLMLYLIYSSHWFFSITLGLILGGAVGNIIDRIRLGYVIDFISVGNFPVFNLADSFATIGAVSIGIYTLYGLFFQNKDEQADKQIVESEQHDVKVEA